MVIYNQDCGWELALLLPVERDRAGVPRYGAGRHQDSAMLRGRAPDVGLRPDVRGLWTCGLDCATSSVTVPRYLQASPTACVCTGRTCSSPAAAAPAPRPRSQDSDGMVTTICGRTGPVRLAIVACPLSTLTVMNNRMRTHRHRRFESGQGLHSHRGGCGGGGGGMAASAHAEQRSYEQSLTITAPTFRNLAIAADISL